jgi:hypothetical protein
MLLLVNKNQEMQKIYCGVSRLQLVKNQENKKKGSLEHVHNEKLAEISERQFS